MLCQSCEALTINGVLCHERVCPDAWKDYKLECKWCGCEFKPENRLQDLCSYSCTCAYHGIPEDESEEDL